VGHIAVTAHFEMLITGEPNMVRDSNSRALLFTNREDIQAYEKRKAEIESQNSQINTLKHNLNCLGMQCVQQWSMRTMC
jgi:hypothetical protein